MASNFQSRIVLGVGVGLGVSYLFYKYMKKEVIPIHWKKIGTLEQFYFYPIKSCAAIEIDAAVCENLGVLEGDIRDRALMLIEDSGQMISARTYPKMYHIVPKIIGRSKILITAPDMEDLELDYSVISEKSPGNIAAIIHGSNATVMDCGEIYHKWFSNFLLGKPEGLRLVYYPHSTPTRSIHKYYHNGVFSKKDTGTLQDISSYMLINIDSVDELNARLKNKVLPLQFRANFNIRTTTPPFDEDYWQWVRIGEDAVFRIVGPCYRCIITLIDPFLGEPNSDGEPLKTLKTFREFSGAPTKSPVMGIQMGLRAQGSVRKGDDIYVC